MTHGTSRHPRDLTDEQWHFIEPFFQLDAGDVFSQLLRSPHLITAPPTA